MNINRESGVAPMFEQDEFLFVRKNLQNPNASRWENTTQFWSEGTPAKSRTTSRRGTHKVYKDKLPAIKKAMNKQKKEEMAAEIDRLADRMLATNFGTRTQFKQMPDGRIGMYNYPQYQNYDPELRERLSRMGIKNTKVGRGRTRRHSRKHKKHMTHRRRRS
jgi:hypothetical protein